MSIDKDPYGRYDTLSVQDRAAAFGAADQVLDLINTKFPELELTRIAQAERLALTMSRITPFASPLDPVPAPEAASFGGENLSCFEIKEVTDPEFGMPILQILRTRPIDPQVDPEKMERACFDFTESRDSYIRTRPDLQVRFQRQEDDVVRRATASDLQELYTELEKIPSQES